MASLSILPASEISTMAKTLDSLKKRRISLDGDSILCKHYEDMRDSLPFLNSPDYFLNPSMNELVRREIENPGYCSRVPDFTIGRIGYGFIKFLGSTDVRSLELDQIVQFQRHEVVVYGDESSKPVVGEGLNKAAEVTLFVNIAYIGLTGTKLGCGEGGCGACTVMVFNYDMKSKTCVHYAVNACLAPLYSVEGMTMD